jgi:hypothetical protein
VGLTNISIDIGGLSSQPPAQLILSPQVVIVFMQSTINIHPGSTLTVGAGSSISFSPGKCATIFDNGGVLNLNGTSNNPITLTSAAASPTPGDWTGIVYTNRGFGGSTGTATYTQISYGGCTNQWSSNGPNYNTGIQINSSTPSLDHVTVDHSLNNGIEIDRQSGTALPSLTNLTLNGNGGGTWHGYGLVYDFPPVDLSGITGLSMSGNYFNAIAISPAIHFTGTGAWPNLGVPYTLYQGSCNCVSNLTLDPGSNLTISSGVTVSQAAVGLTNISIDIGGLSSQPPAQLTLGSQVTMAWMQSTINIHPGSTLTIGPSSTISFAPGRCAAIFDNGGTLNLNGASGSPITLTSAAATPAPGDWTGVIYSNRGFGGSTGTATFTQVSYGGCTNQWSSSGPNYNTGIQINSSNPSLDHVTVDHSLSNGIEIDRQSGTFVPSLTNLTFNQNGTGTLSGNALQYDFLQSDLSNLSSLSASGNFQNAVVLPGGSLAVAGTWPNVGIPLRLTGGLSLNTGANLTVGQGAQISSIGGSLTVASGATLTLQGGNRVAFAPGSFGLWANSGSTVNLSGSPTEPITLTSASGAPVAGDWQGAVLASGSSDILNFVTVSYAGRSLTYNSVSYTTGVLVASGSATLGYPSIASSAGNDVEVVGGVQSSLRFGSYGAVPAGKVGVANDGWVTGQPIVDATYSWWGSPTGPTAATNPGGTGTPVSSGVAYSSWVGKVPGPVLSLSSSSGGSGSSVTLKGSGFGAREWLDIYVGTQLVGATQVEFDITIVNVPLGQISTSITIPSLPPGTYTVQVIGRDSGRMALASFTIT